MGISVCSTLSGKVALKHSELGVLVREDGAVFNRDGDHRGYQWTFGRQLPTGYMRLSIFGKVRNAHRLVAECFIPNPEGKPTVDHINRIREDNRVENLRWATASEQAKNQCKRGTCTYKQSSDPEVTRVLLAIRKFEKNGELKRAEELRKCMKSLGFLD